jgi:hypothetical protein
MWDPSLEKISLRESHVGLFVPAAELLVHSRTPELKAQKGAESATKAQPSGYQHTMSGN